MTGQHVRHAGDHDYDDSELDAIVVRTMSGILAKLEGGFVPGEGLADIYARHRAAVPDMSASPVERDEHPQEKRQGNLPSVLGTRLQAVCNQIDLLDACLTAATRSARNQPFGGAAFLEAARPTLAQLRSGLANRVLARSQAELLVDSFQASLDQADHILRSQHSSSLEEMIQARGVKFAESGTTLEQQLGSLRKGIASLYADAGYTNSLAPAK